MTEHLSIRRNGRGQIWSHIRQRWFLETPEETVRQEFVCTLTNHYAFSLAQMAEEMDTQRGRQHAEADIVIWRSATRSCIATPPCTDSSPFYRASPDNPAPNEC